ncbi:MAG: hypothetical protein AAB532_02760 [Patescibacteria group bacterium]|mgnify:CR=1 FL=1
MSKERKRGQKPKSIRTGNSFLDAMNRYAEIAKAQKDQALANPNLTDAEKQEVVAKADTQIGVALNRSVRVILDASSQVNNRGVRN